MTIVNCDCCGNKIEGRAYEFNPLCNIAENKYHLPVYGYVQKVGESLEPVSSRRVEYDLCLTCYNKIYGAAVDKFVEISKLI
ncbi:MAG TPA: hypothetical protein VIK86_04740 [Candidatus Paceibacterota bacterium]